MTPKEKAVQLYSEYEVLCMDFTRGVSIKEFAKQCAIIAVHEILEVACPDTFACKYYDGDFYSDQDYLIAVKREIEKL